MALSKGAQAVRSAGFKSLKHFREVSRASGGAYARGAMLYARGRGMKNLKAPFSPTSRYARLYGKAFLNKDGTLRKRPNKTFVKSLEKPMQIQFRGGEQLVYEEVYDEDEE